jgi:hypothetical protein
VALAGLVEAPPEVDLEGLFERRLPLQCCRDAGRLCHRPDDGRSADPRAGCRQDRHYQ